MLKHPLGNEAAKRLIVRILNAGTVSFSDHALEEMQKDELTTVDVTNVLRGGVVEFCEEVRKTWRYRVRTSKITVVVALPSDQMIRIVTAWRGTR